MERDKRAMLSIEWVQRNSLTQQSLVLRRCENFLAAVPERTRTVDRLKGQMETPSKIPAFCPRPWILDTTEAHRPRGADKP